MINPRWKERHPHLSSFPFVSACICALLINISALVYRDPFIILISCMVSYFLGSLFELIYCKKAINDLRSNYEDHLESFRRVSSERTEELRKLTKDIEFHSLVSSTHFPNRPFPSRFIPPVDLQGPTS